MKPADELRKLQTDLLRAHSEKSPRPGYDPLFDAPSDMAREAAEHMLGMDGAMISNLVRHEGLMMLHVDQLVRSILRRYWPKKNVEVRCAHHWDATNFDKYLWNLSLEDFLWLRKVALEENPRLVAICLREHQMSLSLHQSMKPVRYHDLLKTHGLISIDAESPKMTFEVWCSRCAEYYKLTYRRWQMVGRMLRSAQTLWREHLESGEAAKPSEPMTDVEEMLFKSAGADIEQMRGLSATERRKRLFAIMYGADLPEV